MDLVVALFLLLTCSAGVFCVVVWLSRGWPRWAFALLGVVDLAAIAAFSYALLDKPAMLRLIPYSGVAVLGNWMMPLCAPLAAIAWRALQVPTGRRTALCCGMAVLTLIVTIRPVISPRPETEDRWFGPVCLQTSDATCSPAAAASLLGIYNITTTEHEMADLCLTTEGGTSLLGLYRGLAMETAGTPYRVEVVTGDVQALHRTPTPILLTVGLLNGQKADPIYTEKWGWMPGVAHSVVLVRFLSTGRALIFDPSVGVEQWKPESLETLWHGTGLRLSGPDPWRDLIVAR